MKYKHDRWQMTMQITAGRKNYIFLRMPVSIPTFFPIVLRIRSQLGLFLIITCSVMKTQWCEGTTLACFLQASNLVLLCGSLFSSFWPFYDVGSSTFTYEFQQSIDSLLGVGLLSFNASRTSLAHYYYSFLISCRQKQLELCHLFSYAGFCILLCMIVLPCVPPWKVFGKNGAIMNFRP